MLQLYNIKHTTKKQKHKNTPSKIVQNFYTQIKRMITENLVVHRKLLSNIVEYGG